MTAVIRNATREEIPRIVEMAREFYATTDYVAIAPMADTSAAAAADMAIGTGTMLVAEQDGELVGMVCLLVVPFMFNPSKTSADEVAWYVSPGAQNNGAGLALLQSIEPACRAAGADMIRMMDMATSPPQAAALYQRMGYALSERTYTKVF